ncbi:MAG: hypothetical protein HOQ24_18225 [Mycobacteriaceae bacterium]|nr:hypothetical protein [Mycobacteriaceae bacterium]
MPFLCNEVPRPLTVDRAHRLMQIHSSCNPRHCPCRRAALDMLVESGRYIPASRYG